MLPESLAEFGAVLPESLAEFVPPAESLGPAGRIPKLWLTSPQPFSPELLESFAEVLPAFRGQVRKAVPQRLAPGGASPEAAGAGWVVPFAESAQRLPNRAEFLAIQPEIAIAVESFQEPLPKRLASLGADTFLGSGRIGHRSQEQEEEGDGSHGISPVVGTLVPPRRCLESPVNSLAPLALRSQTFRRIRPAPRGSSVRCGPVNHRNRSRPRARDAPLRVPRRPVE